MLKVVYIGNRNNIVNSLLASSKVELVKAFILDRNLYARYKDDSRFECISPRGEITEINNYVINKDFDVLISGGCSYILPVDSYPNDKIYINTHPSALPFGKGRHPINESLLSKHQKGGVTIHYLTSGLDAGDILEQVSFDLSDEVDATLLYSFIFELEAELLMKAISKISDNRFEYLGVKQCGVGTYYTRPKLNHTVDLSILETHDFMKALNAFSSKNLGVFFTTNDGASYKAFSGTVINNDFILARFQSSEPGDVCIQSNDALVIKLMNGLVYLKQWEAIE